MKPRGNATTQLGATLRELRERAGLTTAEVAKRSGHSLATCYRVEAGTSRAPDLVDAFARACCATEDELERIVVLLIRDRGVIELPPGVTDEQIRRAVHALFDRYNDGALGDDHDR